MGTFRCPGVSNSRKAMWRAPTRLQMLFVLGLALAVAGFAWILIPSSESDPYFRAGIGKPAYSGRGRPVVLIDEAHANELTLDGLLQPLARILRDDGYFVGPNLRLITSDSLRGVVALLIANADAWLSQSAFSAREIDALKGWVEQGGNLLLAFDAGAPPSASSALAGAFQIRLGEGEAGSEPQLLRRETGQIASHPITDGRIRVEQVEQVMCFGWQSVAGPGTAFLKLPNGKTLGIAAEIGKGRLVVLGNPAMITAQRRGHSPVGFNRGGNDNVRMILNLLHWLSRL
jgi:hypothetical protein